MQLRERTLKAHVKSAIVCAFAQHCSSFSSRFIRQFVENKSFDYAKLSSKLLMELSLVRGAL